MFSQQFPSLGSFFSISCNFEAMGPPQPTEEDRHWGDTTATDAASDSDGDNEAKWA